jgi:hypothetical protein
VAIALCLGLSACGVESGPDAAFAPGGVKDPADQGRSGTSPSGDPVPPGFQRVARKGIGITFAVPKGWSVADVDGGQLTAGQKALAEENPQLAGILEQSSGLYANSKIVSAIGPVDREGAQTAVAAQLGLSLRSIPAAMGDQVASGFDAMGGAKVHTESVAVRGLDDDQESLRIDLTIDQGGRSIEMHELMIPAPDGIVVLAVRARAAIADRILASVAVP